MKLSENEMARLAEEALRTCLAGVPFLKIQNMKAEVALSGAQPDLIVELAVPAGTQYLIVQIKTNGQPRLARQAANQILRYRQSFSGAYGVLLAPYVSAKAAEICADEGIGHIDLSGNCRLCFGQVYIEREGRPNQFAQKRDLRSLYSPKATRVLRVLLANPKKVWKGTDLAGEAAVSVGQASNVKKLLADREWISTEPRGFALREPAKLLAEWAENYSFRQNGIRDYYSLKPPVGIEADLAEVCATRGIRYALTGFSAAARMAPGVRYQRALAYVEETEEDIAAQLNLIEVASGANVSLLLPYDEGVFYGGGEFEGIRTASSVQIYLDLVTFRGRGEEAAKRLLEEVIEPQW